ncbi:MAG: putative molybdenum carrier protein [Actinomycetota bacterium]|nr:putative molybdenum carrier protein [Actinomycetota bacterium]
MLRRVISGGQDGVDVAALRAAKAVGLQTGGYCLESCITVSGSKPDRMREFCLSGVLGCDYPARTKLNVQTSDATFLVGPNLNTPGSRLVKRLTRELGKPLISLTGGSIPYIQQDAEEVAATILRTRAEVLNVAGNRDAPEEPVQAFLEAVFRKVLEEK